MLTSALREYFDNSPVAVTQAYELYYRVNAQRRGLFDTHRLSVSALVILHGTEIDFQCYAAALEKSIGESAEMKIGSLRCTWLIGSDHGGIYLHEAIDTKANRRYKSLTSRFVVMNTGDGTVSFGPGHRDNGAASETMRRLVAEYNAMTKDRWQRLFAQAVDSFLV